MPEETTTTQDQEQVNAAALTEDAQAQITSGDDGEQNREEDSAASAGEQKVDEQKEQGQKPKGGIPQHRLDKEVKRRADAERERDFLREELHRALGVSKQEAEHKPEVKAATSNPEPKIADFEDWDAFNAAQREWLRKEARSIAAEELSAADKRRQDEENKRTKEAETQRQQKEFDAREERASKKHKDWEEIAGTNDEPTVLIELQALHAKKQPGVPAIADVLGKADPDGDLEYYFASNPAEIARIAALEPVKASLELGKLLGTKLAPQESSASTATAAGGTTKALPPPRTLSKTAPTATAAGADLKDDEYFARREKQIAEAQRKGRKR